MFLTLDNHGQRRLARAELYAFTNNLGHRVYLEFTQVLDVVEVIYESKRNLSMESWKVGVAGG